jgi:1-acyl-sn-glycerol-3-phosphate acyltransferase
MSELKPQNYKDDRPAEYFARFHERSRTKDPGWTYELVRMILTPIALLFYRTRAIESENVPASGPVILASNHFSNMDHFLAGIYLRRKIRFLAKSQLFGNPIGDYIFSTGGVFPIRRGHHDEEAFKTSAAPRRRARGARVRRPGGPGCDPWLAEHPAVEAARVPEGDGPLRPADQLPRRRRSHPRTAARVRERDL